LTHHCRKNALEDGAEDVEDIAQEPDDDELGREPFCAAPPKIGDDLRREDDD
jgi:hypothetical protein